MVFGVRSDTFANGVPRQLFDLTTIADVFARRNRDKLNTRSLALMYSVFAIRISFGLRILPASIRKAPAAVAPKRRFGAPRRREGCRTPGRFAKSGAFTNAPASWTAVALHRFPMLASPLCYLRFLPLNVFPSFRFGPSFPPCPSVVKKSVIFDLFFTKNTSEQTHLKPVPTKTLP